MQASLPTTERPILVAVDFSDDSMQALLWADRQARLEGAPLTILHVVHDPAASPGFYHKMDENWLRPMTDIAREMMDDFLARAKTDHPELATLEAATIRLVTGLPANRIVEVAQEAGVRMVVIGSRGRTSLHSILLGSIAERVAQICSIPVVIVKTPASEEPA